VYRYYNIMFDSHRSVNWEKNVFNSSYILLYNSVHKSSKFYAQDEK